MCNSGVALDGGAVVCGTPARGEENSTGAQGWSQQTLLQCFGSISRCCLFCSQKLASLCFQLMLIQHLDFLANSKQQVLSCNSSLQKLYDQTHLPRKFAEATGRGSNLIWIWFYLLSRLWRFALILLVLWKEDVRPSAKNNIKNPKTTKHNQRTSILFSWLIPFPAGGLWMIICI